MIKLKEGFLGSRIIVLPPYIREQIAGDPLLSALHITDIGYFPKASHHYVERPRGTDEYVFIYCVDGAGSYTVGSSSYDVKEGQYFVLPPNVPHSYKADEHDPWTIYWIHGGGTLAPYYLMGGTQPRTVSLEMSSRIATRANIFEEIFQTLHQGFGLEHLQYASCLFHYYIGTLRYINQYRATPAPPGRRSDASAAQQADAHSLLPSDGAGQDAHDKDGLGWHDATPDGMMAAAIHYMHENIEKHITLAQIAGYVGYSTSHFSHLFQQETGESPLSYLNRIKVDEAARLLTTTDMKINQICYKVGFDDPYYFSRLFSKLMGLSPRNYRITHA